MREKTRQGERKYLRFLHHEKRSHTRSGVHHLHSRYNLLGPPVLFNYTIIVPGRRRVKKKKERKGTHFCEDCDRSKGIPKVYSYDRLQGWYFYRSLRATVRELSIERHSQVLMLGTWGMSKYVDCRCKRQMPNYSHNRDDLISELDHRLICEAICEAINYC
jgi:hypothetical protein